MKDKQTLPENRTQGLPTEERSSAGEVAAFLKQAKASVRPGASRRGRIILALDATMSRQPTWDLACKLQAGMFDAVRRSGGLEVQLVYFRGFGECRASRFVADTDRLKTLMTGIDCRGGLTQIGKVLAHCAKESRREKVHAVVYIGDAMEEEVDELADRAGRLGLQGTPVFMFQEGRDGAVERAYREIARLTRGAWFRFDRESAGVLERLLSSIAVYASGGLEALEQRASEGDLLLLENLRGGSGR